MSLDPLLRRVAADAAVTRFLECAGRRDVVDVAAAAGLRGPLLALLSRTGERGTPVLAVTATGRQADDLASALRTFLPTGRVATFPSWETLPHERLSPRSDTVGRRLAVLRRLAHPGDPGEAFGPIDVLVTSVRAALQPIAPGLGELAPVQLRAGDDADLEEVVHALSAAAYTRTDLVERRGEFAVRGGILDVFPPTESHPLRIEFFGDTVEEVRWFKVADQRSLEIAPEGLWAPPCRELLLTDRVRARAAELAEQLPGVAEMLHRVSEGIAVEGMESLSPLLLGVSGGSGVSTLRQAQDDALRQAQDGALRQAQDGALRQAQDDALRQAQDDALRQAQDDALRQAQDSASSTSEVGMLPLLDAMPAGTHVVLSDPERMRTRAYDLVATNQEFLQASWSNAAAGNRVPIDLQRVLGSASYWTLAQLREHALAHGYPWWSLSSFRSDEELTEFATDELPGERIGIDTREVPQYRSSTDAAVADLRRWVSERRRVLVVTEGAGLARRVSDVLAENDIPVRPLDTDTLEPGTVQVTTGMLTGGFELPGADLVVLTESDLTGTSGQGGSTKDMRRMPSRRRNIVDPLQLNPGDFVVHEQHGVGKFVEMTQRTVAGATREYLVLEYAPSKRGRPGDRLFVPTDQLDQVTRYVGGDMPTLNKMGGSDWQQTKSRARKHVRQIAAELIRLYSARMATKGHAFAPDTPWQAELEDAFGYVETPDQLSSIDEVKADMEKPVPMDRLICGDVGYGKTEIAVRAAFKAIQDGKQVAVLVPTTLLVNQHLQTFGERYAGFPVVVRALSRFQTDKQAKEVLAGLASGAIDLVIGTHRLLGSTVKFKDLGLVVIDEEQRFGVEHKEQLKQLRTAVDVLAMSATPIPRTLEMAVTGIRQMSTLATPPEERHPVLTFVGAYDEKQVAAAIRRELMREGQVFFVHNKVRSIEKAAARLRELVPEARVATAHGQMSERRLENVVVDFWERRSDVLVCTTIIETGLDISNANTLIVDRADVMGLSQLHQLRGRVGRGRERAYSYFLFPPEKPLTETAHDRLRTIASHTDLGAGMQVAMKDLEIRGAGNLLGGEQSGHIAGVGFDLYVRMVGEAVADYRGETPAGPAEMKIELPVDAHLPHEYVPGERLRLEAYKKLAAVEDEEAVAEIIDELRDRYGEPPQPVQRLFEVARLRILARRAGIGEITAQGRYLRFAPVSLRESQQLRLERLYRGTTVKATSQIILVPAPKTAPVGGRPLRNTELLQWAQQLIRSVLLDDLAAAAQAATGTS